MECRNCGKEIKEGIEVNVHAFGISPPVLMVCSRKCENIFTNELLKRYNEAHTPGKV